MYWLSIIYFLADMLITGTLIDLFVKDWKADWLEKLVMRFGVGLAATSVIGVILNLLHIPLDYRVFLGVGLLILLSSFARNKQLCSLKTATIAPALAQCWKNKTFWYALFMLVLFAVTVNMYVGGSFKYDYFEDTDPWGYTVVADYIGEHRTYSVPYYSTQYSEPYTQGYQILMGVLSQTNDSIYWTMKFFSALIISLSILFMYYFARRFARNEEIAVLATFFLFAVPAWVSHFVFSVHYNMTLYVVLLYVLAQLMYEHPDIAAPLGKRATRRTKKSRISQLTEKQDKNTAWLEYGLDFLSGIEGWMYVGIVVYASMLINHFSTALHGSVFCFVFVVTRILAERRIDWKTIMVFMGGFLLSLLFFIPAYVKHWWLTETTQRIGGIGTLFPLMRFVASPFGIVTVGIVLAAIVFIYRSRNHWQQSIEGWLDVRNRGLLIWLCGLALVLIVLLQPQRISHTLGTGDRYYEVSHFFGSRAYLTNNPVGLGFVLMSAVLASFLLASAQMVRLFKPVNAWVAVSYAWIITALLLVLGRYFSIAIIPYRAWTFLGLFASLFAAWGMVTFIRSISKREWISLGAIALLVGTVIPTSFMEKHRINTQIWRDHQIGSPQSRALFTWMRDGGDGGISKNSVVAHLCGNSEFLSGYDMNPPVWDEVFHPKRGVEEPYFVAHPLKMTPEAYSVLKNAHVEYVTIGASCRWQAPPDQQAFIDNLLEETMNEYVTDSRLVLIKSTGHELLFKLK